MDGINVSGNGSNGVVEKVLPTGLSAYQGPLDQLIWLDEAAAAEYASELGAGYYLFTLNDNQDGYWLHVYNDNSQYNNDTDHQSDVSVSAQNSAPAEIPPSSAPAENAPVTTSVTNQGSNGPDDITPSSSDDVINPGLGDDSVDLSNGGQDEVHYHAGSSGRVFARSGADYISGFKRGEDIFKLQIDSNGSAPADLDAFLESLDGSNPNALDNDDDLIISLRFGREDDGNGNIIEVIAGLNLLFMSGFVTPSGQVSSPIVKIDFEKGIAIQDFLNLVGGVDNIDLRNLALKRVTDLKAILGEGSLAYEAINQAPVAPDVDISSVTGQFLTAGGELNISNLIEQLTGSGLIYDPEGDTLTITITSLTSIEDLFSHENVKHGVRIELISGGGGFAGVVLKFGQDGTSDGTATGDDAGGALQINFKDDVPTFSHTFYDFDFDTLTLVVKDENKSEFIQELFGGGNIDVTSLADFTADYSITIL